MMTTASKQSMEWLFRKSIEENLLAAFHASRVLISNKPEGVDNRKNRKIFVLNISSYTFRVVVLFNFGTDGLTHTHFSRQSSNVDEGRSKHKLEDSIAELANMICGSVNRHLSEAFRHAGMSTPIQLDSACAHYISMLAPSHVMRFEVKLDDLLSFDVMICTCLSQNTKLDFTVDQLQHEDIEHGALELF